MVYLAVDNGILRFNPLDDIQYEKKPPKKLMYISKSQLQDIMNHPKLNPLHELGFAHQFKHNLSYHQSRHTFGTLLVSAGVPMESIAKMMGRTNIRTTQDYAKVTDDKISEDIG